MKRLIPIVLLSALGASSAAHADFYVGASLLSTDAEIVTAAETFDTDDSSFKAYAGFTFFKFVAFEATYRDMGTHQQTRSMDSINFDLEAFDVSARGIIPIGKRFSVFGRVGYANISVDGGFDVDDVVGVVDNDEWELLYGAGIEVTFLGHVGLRVEWEEYDADADLNSFSAGAFFRF